MKKVVAAICIFALALSFSACGEIPDVSSSLEDSSTAIVSETVSESDGHIIVTFVTDDNNSATRKLATGEAIGQMPIPVRDGYRFMAWADSFGMPFYEDSVPTGDITLYATWEELGALTITRQPKDARCNKGDSVEFTIEANSTAGAIRYQWQYYDSDKNLFVDFTADDGGWASNWNTSRLGIWSDVYDALQVQCVVESGDLSVISSVACMTVEYPDPLIIQNQPVSDTAVIEGPNGTDTLVFVVTASGGVGPYYYQWMTPIMGGVLCEIGNGAWEDTGDLPSFYALGADTNILKLVDVTVMADQMELCCRVTDSVGNEIYSNYATIICNVLGA